MEVINPSIHPSLQVQTDKLPPSSMIRSMALVRQQQILFTSHGPQSVSHKLCNLSFNDTQLFHAVIIESHQLCWWKIAMTKNHGEAWPSAPSSMAHHDDVHLSINNFYQDVLLSLLRCPIMAVLVTALRSFWSSWSIYLHLHAVIHFVWPRSW